MPRFAANLTLLFADVRFLDRFDAAARAGFRAVEFVSPYDHAPEEVARAARDAGVEVALFNLPAGDWGAGRPRDGVRSGARRRVPRRRRARPRLRGRARLPAPPRDGGRPAGGRRRRRRCARRTWRPCASPRARSGRRGGRCSSRGSTSATCPGYYLTTSRQAFELMDAVGAPNLHYLYDVYHMQIMEGDLAATLERRLDRIGHVQIADPPGRHEPGTGEVNFGFLLRHLDRIGYRGLVGCEYRPRAGTVAGLSWMEEFRHG